ncbi:MAG TPA: hypothetical protein VNJ12_06660 [Candidatus Dormibacteraeota bacterium]|nr:hypothetical protein [Candidatus Dormibacteraeota bacterium]
MTHWMQDAVKRPGALTRKARRMHEAPTEFAETHAHAPGLTGRQARFAMIAQGKPIPTPAAPKTPKRRRPLLPRAAAGR